MRKTWRTHKKIENTENTDKNHEEESKNVEQGKRDR